MEAIGLGVGVAGLAGLFSSCIECFELVQRGRYLGQEYTILETKFTNQRLRLLTWGWACGFADPERYDNRLEDEELRSCIEATLLHLISLLNNGKELKNKYGLKQEQTGHHVLAVASSALDTLIGRSLPSTTTILGQKLHDFRDKIVRTQKGTKFTSAMRWAIEDKQKFTELVQHLKDLIDDLEGLTKWLDTAERQRNMLKCEVQSISDVSVLESMEEARLGRIDAVSDAASLRLWELRDYQRLEIERPNTPRHPSESSQNSIHSLEAEWEDVADDTHNGPEIATDTRYQVLHRVFCQHEATSIYLDPPSYNIWNGGYNQWLALDTEHPAHEPTAIHLCGRRTVPNLDAYLIQNWQLSFVVFRNYKCLHEFDRCEASDGPNFDQTVYLSSEEMCTSLRELCQRVTDISKLPEFCPGAELRAPYLWYYHSRESLEIELKGTVAQSRHSHDVQTLLDFISDSMGDEYTAVESLLSTKMISWKFLPYLFASEELVIHTQNKSKDYWQAHEMIDMPTVNDADENSTRLQVKVRSWAFDGNFQRLNSTLEIHQSHFGESGSPMPISSLSVVPFTHAEHCSREYFEIRGGKFWSYRHTRYVTYNESTADLEDFAAERFMINASQYHAIYSSDDDASTNSHRLDDDLGREAMVSDRPPAGNFLLLLPPTIPGLNIQKLQWQALLISKTAPVVWNKKALDRLVLDQDKKNLLTMLLTSTTTIGDIKSRNGVEKDNLVVLFHGGPGTGKSFTAKAFAEVAEKALYQYSCSDIGTDVKDVRVRLRDLIGLENSWNCVALLRDADVLVSRRTLENTVHNTFVTQLIDFLDHFSGILFLTTNQVGTFDEAFMSRVKFSVHFPSLDSSGRKEIWRNFIQDQDLDTRDDLGGTSELEDRASELAKDELNGMQIKHCFRAAVKIARSRGEKLHMEHFRMAKKTFVEFNDYIESVRRAKPSQLASRSQTRDDEWSYRKSKMEQQDNPEETSRIEAVSSS
ncbi:unnamed protein product [Periconia digitata]|uniref:AAA+ ATPase domain-containing protein n=1 Tax=Periconia digitata TaxID=1303443 RepID=A0A9W4UQY1_9PLEO|nr:unnamed protein product [Periconia digitata]